MMTTPLPVLFCELPVVPVWVGSEVRVELRREEENDEMLLLPTGVDEGPEETEEAPEGESGTEVPLVPTSMPVPQGILSPFG